VWFADPDGHQWEVFVVTQADIPEHTRAAPGQVVGQVVGPIGEAAGEATETRSCCAPSCCK
jgi:hypothetical protein